MEEKEKVDQLEEIQENPSETEEAYENKEHKKEKKEKHKKEHESLRKELEELIARAKFSVYPSIWYENCPLSILESESLGTPVITAKNGGMMELVEDNKTGILVENINHDNSYCR